VAVPLLLVTPLLLAVPLDALLADPLPLPAPVLLSPLLVPP
jgi:hypothetical protein